jgi:peptide/nickel transport system ATP-binding protein
MIQTTAAADRRVLEVQHLAKHYPISIGFPRRTVGYIRAVDDVSFSIDRGETLGLVGESGCGKTTTARCILRAIKPSLGRILFRSDADTLVDVVGMRRNELLPLRKRMQMIFQDPFSSLNPRMNLLDIIGEPLFVNGLRNRQERIDRVSEMMSLVGLRTEYLQRYPHAFSGGQRQRISIARALILRPDLVVADEPVSALDVSVQAQILNLLLSLQEKLDLTYLFVAHDLSVVKHISDRVAVMYVGKIVEVAPTKEIFSAPQHPYTEALLSAVPRHGPHSRSNRILLEGDVPDASKPPSGCYFHPRCRYSAAQCKFDAPSLREIVPGRFISCHRAQELELSGI